MARVTAVAWLVVVVGMKLATAAALAAPPADDTPGTSTQGQGRPSRTQVALTTAIDSYRRGEYEFAVSFFQQAQTHQADLAPAQRQDLANWLKLNNTALQARKEGAEKLQQAEKALRAGQPQEAAALLSEVSANQQFLKPADRQKAQQLNDQLRPDLKQQANPASKTAQVVARQKLQQARTFLANGNLDAAEKLASEAEQLNATFSAEEDTPRKVLEDAAKARIAGTKPGDSKVLLTAARAALAKGDLDGAERLAREAEKTGSTWSSFRLWGDSPAKVLKEVQSARSRPVVHQTPPAPTATPAQEKETSSTFEVLKFWNRSSKTDPDEAARTLAEARQLYEQGRLDEAEALSHRADQLHGPYGLLEMGDRPQKLRAEIEQARARAGKAKTPATTVAMNSADRGKPAAGVAATTAPQNPMPVVSGAPRPRDAQLPTIPVSPPPTAANASPSPRERGVALLKQATAELRRGETAKARKLAEEAYSSPYGVQAEADKMLRALDMEEFNQSVLAAKRNPTAAPARPATTPTGANRGDRGKALLAQATQELQKGETAKARRLAEEAFVGPFGVQDQAEKLLDTIDAQEFRQQTAKSTASYEAALAAFQAKEYAKANALFTALDAKHLKPEQTATVHECLKVCQAQVAGQPRPVVQKPAVPSMPTQPVVQAPAAPSQMPVAQRPTAARTSTPRGNQTEAAQQLLIQGRKALAQGDTARARQLAHQARGLKADLKWSDDNPEKLLAEVQRVEAGKQPGASAQTASTITDPHALLAQARALYTKGDLDEAEKVAQRANVSGHARWGLFEDSPDKLLSDIRKMRAKRDHEESVQVLAEARKVFAEGKLNEAERMSYRADHLHGPYGPLELGDRPHKLRADIEEARLKERKIKLPPAPPTAVARMATGTPERPATATPSAAMPNEVRTVGATAVGQMPPVADSRPMPPTMAPDASKQIAQRLLAESRQFQKEGRLIEARQKALDAQKTGAVFSADEDRPELALLAVAALGEKQIESLMQRANACIAANPSDPTCYQKAEAELAQARKLAEAFRFDTKPLDNKIASVRQLRDKSRTAAAAPAPVSVPFEVPPQKNVAQAQHVQTPATAAVPAQTGQTMLNQALAELRRGDTAKARTLAEQVRQGPYGMQTQAAEVLRCIDAEIDNQQKLATARATDRTAPTGGTAPVVAQQRGQMLLDQARLELRRGETGNARRLAEEACAGPFGVQAEAQNVIRSIDAEEYNQRSITASRSFDAGMSAFQRRDYAQAGTIFRSLDVPHLPRDKQSRLKEIIQMPEMQLRAGVTQAALKTPLGSNAGEPGRARASDQGPSKIVTREESFAEQVRALREVEFQKLHSQTQEKQREAMARMQAGDDDRAIEILQECSTMLRESELEADRLALLKRPVDTRLQEFKMLKAQHDFQRSQANQHETASKMLSRIEMAEEQKKKAVAEQMKQYNILFKEGKYKEAEMYAMRAHELDPDNPVPGAAIYTARIQANQVNYDEIKRKKEALFVDGLNQAEDPGAYVDSNRPLSVDARMAALTSKRKGFDAIRINTQTETERAIERRLMMPYTLDFKDTPLQQVIDDLHDMTGINIVPDVAALTEEGISLNRPVSMKLEQLALKSALNLLLRQVHLTYVIKDDVLQITTEANARGRMKQVTYGVGDLIIPVEDTNLPSNSNLLRTALAGGTGEASNLHLNGATPFLSQNSLRGGNLVGSTAYGSGQPDTGTQHSGTLITKHAPQQTMQELLIKLITNTIAPQTWSDMGGQGTIEYFPLGMALIITQTPDIQEQIAELLAALRRLQDQEVAVEVRFITIAESFFERIGVDFNINIKTDKYTTKYEPQIVSQQFKPFGFVNDFNPKKTVIGLTPANSFTTDLDIPIRTSSFNQAIPPFGAFPAIPGGNGGLELGLAFLSDIQVFLFMEAAQGDQRTNVMQAPKLTLFNGQTASINVSDMQFFVTSVQVFQAGGQVVFVPQNNLLPTGGVSLVIQAVISADRRFVRLNLQPNITNITSAIVQLFPITTFITPVFEGGAVGQPVPFTQFLQQPVFNNITVQTTVTVPDGGTVLLGGLKRLSEGRNEFGPPILSKIPYINRLFKNVGYGRETESLLLMVTPRIIINEEEELRQTGVGAGAEGVVPPLGQEVP